MKTIRLIMAMMIACVCFTSCSSDDDDNGINPPITVEKRIKNVTVTDYFTAEINYADNNISKITIKSLEDWNSGKTLVMSYEHQSNKIIKTVSNDFYNGDISYTETYNIIGGLIVNDRYKFSSGYISSIDEELVFKYDNNWSVITCPSSIGSSTVTVSKIENKTGIWPLELYHYNPRYLEFYLGIFGKPTKYLPEKITAIENPSDFMAISYTFDNDGYVSQITYKGRDGYSWTETYAYEQIP